MNKRIIVLALAFFAPLAGLYADTSYLLIQGQFGNGGTTEQTFEWKVNYPNGYLVTGQDLLTAVFGPATLSGTYNDDFGGTYNSWVASNSRGSVQYIDFATDPDNIGQPTTLTEPFVVSFTLNGVPQSQATDYSSDWNYYVAGGGSNKGLGYDNNGAWTFSNDGTYTRTLVDGSFDGFVLGIAPDFFGNVNTFIDGAGNTPTAGNFAGATEIDVTPEPGSAVLSIMGAGGMLALLRRRRNARGSTV